MSRNRRRQIYLVGFMGSGKSSVGALLAGRLHWPFIDLDETIEAGQGLNIRQIFENAGEPFFREIEHAALAEASKSVPVVIALGGGTFAQKTNLDFIQETGGVTVWLDCPLEELRRRCAGITTRPLFRDRESFAQLLALRMPYYQQAAYRVSTAVRDPRQVAEEILELEIF